ncbi:MAG TPA: hypothetical protein VMU62_10700 [Acidobacteriaceae bacterium]|nr:hypothetical protein [Acidobacteriaceae bacterium]
MNKIWTITLVLVRQNRWLILLIVAWPWAFLALLTFPGRGYSQGDIESLLQQEYFYGIALTMLLAAGLLGAELRARRVTAILCRAVSRNQYLLALWMTALLPAVLFAAFVFLSVWMAAGDVGFSARTLLPFVLNLLSIELWMAVCGILYSLFLPALLASLAAGLTAGTVVLIGWAVPSVGVGFGLGPLLFAALRGGKDILQVWLAIASTLVQVAILAVLSQRIFKRKDLPSAGE